MDLWLGFLGAGGITSEALFDAMCFDTSLEEQRFDYGWLMDEIANYQAQTASCCYSDGVEVSHYFERL